MRASLIVTLFLFGLVGGATAHGAPIDEARALWQSGQAEKAMVIANSLIQAAKDEDERALAQFLLGTIQLKQGRFDDARTSFEKLLVLKTNLTAYSFYQLGESYLGLKRFRDAKAAFDRVGYFKPPTELRYQVRQKLAEIAVAEKQWGEAERHLVFLEKKWRRSPEYPEILWQHLQITIKSEARGADCKVAKKLYTQFPSHPLLYDWGIDLQNAQIEGQRLGCIATPSEQTMRLRRLQLAGESDRARREIEQLRAGGGETGADQADMMLVQFLISDGFADEALQILLRLYPRHENEVPFLLTLAKAASRAGEYQAAVGSYIKAYERDGGGRAGREALFQAAFQSYQFQDYDGATRRFEQFIEKFPRSGLAKDARWQIAWMRYLRGDFAGALARIAELQHDTRSSRRAAAKAPDDKLNFWVAMSLVRLRRSEEARQVFQSIVSRDPTSYYAQASAARLEGLPAKAPETAPLPVAVRDLAAVAVTESVVVPSAAEPALSTVVAESEESTPDDGADTPAVDLADDGAVDRDDDDAVEVTDFKDPRLRRHFEIARDLMAVGFESWSKYELYEVERRSRNPAYLKMLIKAYEGIQSYHRAVAISDTSFAAERTKQGFNGARPLWESAYPKAYGVFVSRYADQFSISPDLIWSIMRAESHFKVDVMSPVGARGLLQLMPETGRQVSRLLGDDGNFQPASLLNPETNVRLGARYLLRLSSKFKGSLPLVAAGYNGGPHRVDSWLFNFGHLDMDEFVEHIPYQETRNYVKKVVRNFAVYRSLYAGDKKTFAWLAAPISYQVANRPATRESWE